MIQILSLAPQYYNYIIFFNVFRMRLVIKLEKSSLQGSMIELMVKLWSNR